MHWGSEQGRATLVWETTKVGVLTRAMAFAAFRAGRVKHPNPSGMEEIYDVVAEHMPKFSEELGTPFTIQDMEQEAKKQIEAKGGVYTLENFKYRLSQRVHAGKANYDGGWPNSPLVKKLTAMFLRENGNSAKLAKPAKPAKLAKPENSEIEDFIQQIVQMVREGLRANGWVRLGELVKMDHVEMYNEYLQSSGREKGAPEIPNEERLNMEEHFFLKGIKVGYKVGHLKGIKVGEARSKRRK